MIALVSLAIIIVFFVGRPGFDLSKIAGMGLAIITVIPVLILLVRAMKAGDGNQVLITFGIGFFIKLVILLLGVWLGVSKAGFDLTTYVASCLTFVFAFQVCESIYFWANKESINST